MSKLHEKNCVPCQGGVPPLKGTALNQLGLELPNWRIVEEHHLLRTWWFPDFARALQFVNQVGALAEAEGHHPDITLGWGRAEIKIFTHKIDGLTESDFVLAAKIDAIKSEP